MARAAETNLQVKGSIPFPSTKDVLKNIGNSKEVPSSY